MGAGRSRLGPVARLVDPRHRGEPASAFFHTTTRFWELGVGALVAVGAKRWQRIPRLIGNVLAWAGLGFLVCGAFVQSTDTPWPGSAALVPTVATAAVIVGGFNAGATGPVRLLGLRPLLFVGALSYSLYLWHWPMVVVATARWGELSVGFGLLVVTLSVAPAWLTYRLIENPLRRSRAVANSPRLALGMGANFTLVGLAAGLLLGVAVGPSVAAGGVVGSVTLGATAMGEEMNPSTTELGIEPALITPDPVRATQDVPSLYADGCQVPQTAVEVVSCEYGDPAGTFVIAVVGDSKVAEWVPAIERIADEEGWLVRTYTKSNCAWSAAETAFAGAGYSECDEWGRRVLDRLTGTEKPDVVLTSAVGNVAIVDGDVEQTSQAAMEQGYASYWSALGDAGVGVVALADTPAPGFEVYECVSEHPDQLSECSFDRNDGSGTPALRQAATRIPIAAFVDMNDWICPISRCPPVIGNVLVYRQTSHVTATYVETLAPALKRRLEPAIEQVRAAASEP